MLCQNCGEIKRGKRHPTGLCRKCRGVVKQETQPAPAPQAATPPVPA